MDNVNAINIITANKVKNSSKRKKTFSYDKDFLTTNKNNILEYYLNLPIKNSTSYIKIVNDDFLSLKYSEYDKLLINNYNVTQLKNITKQHNLKISGNKEFLKKRLYNYLYFTYNIIVIQKNARLYTLKKYINIHGPAFFKRTLCSNDVDFCTLDDLITIPYNQFISFKDANNHVFGFDVLSLYNLFLQFIKYNAPMISITSNENLINVENPFNKQLMSYNVLTQLLEFIRLSNLLKIDITLKYDDLAILSDNKRLEMTVLTLFQRMDSLGNYTNVKWFMNLDKYGLIKFIRELMDIWNYRANLSQETKRDIAPPHGNPFYNGEINNNMLPQYHFNEIRKYGIYIIDLMINKGINQGACSLGSYYVLSALTLVSYEAAEALPWLYEAVN